jgi:hypothetical protein
MFKKSFVLLFFVTTTGCTVRPLPENTARVDTYQIVQKIRCEVRDVVKARLVETILSENPSSEARNFAIEVRDNKKYQIKLSD